MTTYCAVVKYALDDTDRVKRRLLHDGLGEVACELVGLGYTLDQVEQALEDARSLAEDEIESIAEYEAAKKNASRQRESSKRQDSKE